jgi:hypothetical protein
MIIDTQKELVHLFHQLIGKYGNDIVIKGAFSLILNALEKYPTIKDRMTIDIDFYLKREFSDFMEDLKISSISDTIGNPYDFEKQRTPKKNSAGRITATQGNLEIILDVQIDDYPYPATLESNGLQVAVTKPVSIVIDKLDAISKAKVVNRPKDLFDLYVVSRLRGFEFKEIYNHPAFKISGDFENFIDCWEAIAEAYKVSDIIAKGVRPNFDDLYIRVKEFVSPFIVTDELLTQELKWDMSSGVWVRTESPPMITVSDIFTNRRNKTGKII